jgi:OFA family oxalate/formate antiporter-like MFS transporter
MTYPGMLLAMMIGPKAAFGISTALIWSGVFSSSFATSYPAFLVLYGVIFSFGMGLSYTTSFVVAWSHWPNNKGIVSGIITSGFGLAVAVFSIISTSVLNPDNLSPDVKV